MRSLIVRYRQGVQAEGTGGQGGCREAHRGPQRAKGPRQVITLAG